MKYKNTIRICERCNKEYIPKQHNQKICNHYCNRINLSTAMFKCQICKKEFKPRVGNNKYCSPKCGKINKNIIWRRFYRNNKGYEPVKKINCIICGEEFLRTRISQKYCKNEACKLKYLRKRGRERSKKDKQKILERRKNNVEYCIMNKLRMRIIGAVKTQKTYKSYKTRILIGCTVQKIKQYLEDKFEKNMSWENYGKYGWHIDHIIPCSAFDLTNEEEQKKMFSLY